MTYRALVSTNNGGAPKNFEGDFLGFRKSTLWPFSKGSSSDGFYPIGSKFGTKMAKHVILKSVSPIFDFRPETRDIPTRAKNSAAFYKPRIQIRISSERDKNSKIRIIRRDLELAKLDHHDL